MKNFDYIKKCNKQKLAELLTTFIIDTIQCYNAEFLPEEECYFTDDEIDDEYYALLLWLDSEMIEPTELN